MNFRYLLIVLALSAAFASDSWGQLKEASPSKQAAQPLAADQRGTDQVPFAVKILPATDAKEQAEKAERERKEKAIVDDKVAFETQRIADYTDRLAWFTLILSGVAILQAGLFLWQLRYMRQSIVDAAIAANASARSATALVASERARFFVVLEKHNLSDLIKAVRDTGRLTTGENFSIQFNFKNYGKTPGILKERVVGSIVADDLPQTLPLPLSVKDFPETMIGSHDSTKSDWFSPNEFPIPAEVGEVGRNNKRFWFYGRLYYDDVFGDPQVHCFYFRSKSNTAGEHCVLEPVEPKGHKKST